MIFLTIAILIILQALTSYRLFRVERQVSQSQGRLETYFSGVESNQLEMHSLLQRAVEQLPRTRSKRTALKEVPREEEQTVKSLELPLEADPETPRNAS